MKLRYTYYRYTASANLHDFRPLVLFCNVYYLIAVYEYITLFNTRLVN